MICVASSKEREVSRTSNHITTAQPLLLTFYLIITSRSYLWGAPSSLVLRAWERSGCRYRRSYTHSRRRTVGAIFVSCMSAGCLLGWSYDWVFVLSSVHVSTGGSFTGSVRYRRGNYSMFLLQPVGILVAGLLGGRTITSAPSLYAPPLLSLVCFLLGVPLIWFISFIVCCEFLFYYLCTCTHIAVSGGLGRRCITAWMHVCYLTVCVVDLPPFLSALLLICWFGGEFIRMGRPRRLTRRSPIVRTSLNYTASSTAWTDP
jgi:hypothetical protein